jgi:hypothetical protein
VTLWIDYQNCFPILKQNGTGMSEINTFLFIHNHLKIMTVVKINNWDPEKTLSMSNSPNTYYGENKKDPNG